MSAVDGKTARGSRDRAKNRNPLHRVSAWANANRRVLGKVFTVDRNDFAVHWIKLEHRYYAFEIIG